MSPMEEYAAAVKTARGRYRYAIASTALILAVAAVFVALWLAWVGVPT